MPEDPWHRLQSCTATICSLLDLKGGISRTGCKALRPDKEQLRETLDEVAECFAAAIVSAMDEGTNYEGRLRSQ